MSVIDVTSLKRAQQESARRAHQQEAVSSLGQFALRATSLDDVFDRALGVFGSERVLFGTDSSVFPRGWRQDLYTLQREALGALGGSEVDRGRIFGRNAAQLLGLEI